MFLGTHEPRLDEKGRLILPARFREELSSGLVITKGQERCLYVFPATEFEALTQTLKESALLLAQTLELKFGMHKRGTNISQIVKKVLPMFQRKYFQDSFRKTKKN
jgi:division/cell wall cluster transcriptional repressor MraZ